MRKQLSQKVIWQNSLEKILSQKVEKTVYTGFLTKNLAKQIIKDFKKQIIRILSQKVGWQNSSEEILSQKVEKTDYKDFKPKSKLTKQFRRNFERKSWKNNL